MLPSNTIINVNRRQIRTFVNENICRAYTVVMCDRFENRREIKRTINNFTLIGKPHTESST